jgi:fumarate reductase subunit C
MRREVRLWLAQRISAGVLAFCVVVHLVTMIVVVRGGLSAGEILARTHGNAAWLTFYVVFVTAVSIHAPIGLRTIVGETVRWRGRGLDLATGAFAILLFVAGLRAVLGLYL